MVAWVQPTFGNFKLKMADLEQYLGEKLANQIKMWILTKKHYKISTFQNNLLGSVFQMLLLVLLDSLS